MVHYSAMASLLWLLVAAIVCSATGFSAVAAAPQISQSPLNRNVLAGSGHVFSVTASGTAPLRYQWQFNGVPITGATNVSLSLVSIQTNAAGFYAAVVANLEGSATSSVARLTVRTTNDAVYPVPHAGWSYLYDGAGVAGDLTAALDGTWNHELDSWSGDGRGAGNGLPGGVSSLNGVATIEDGVTNAAGGTFNNRRFYFTRSLALDAPVTNANTILNDGVTLTFRARLTPPADPLIEISDAPNGLVNNSDGKGMFGIRQAGASGMLIGFSLAEAGEDTGSSGTFNFGQAGLHMNHLNGDVRTNNVDPGEAGTLNLLPLNPDVFHEFWITIQDNGADPGTHRVSIYVDGSLAPAVFNVTAGTGVDGPATNYLALGMGSTAQRGAVDVDFFGYRAGAVSPSAFNQPAGIVSPPVSQFVAQGQFAAFQVGVTGTPPYSFQWYRNGAPVPGATNAGYSLGPVSPADEAAKISVRVANEFNAVTSAPPAEVHLASVPVIVGQPASVTVTNGDAAQLSVSVNSPVAPAYQWRRAGNVLPGETNVSLVFSPATPASAGSYDVVVANSSGSVTSQVAVLTVVNFDYGDAPDAGFRTLRSSDGARHRVVAGVSLGATVDIDADGQPAALADGDDLSGADDEDGIVFQGEWIVGQSAPVLVTASVAGFVSAWVDWNHDGNWNSGGEQVLTNVAVTAGGNSLSIKVPLAALAGNGLARFRFSTAGGLGAFGPAADGEVEDYTVSVAPRADLVVATAVSGNPVPVGADFSWSVMVSNQGPSIASGVVLSNGLPPGAAFTGVSSSQGACFQMAGRVECDLGAIPASGIALVEISLRPSGAAALSLPAQVSSAVIDLVPGNNSAMTSVTALFAPAVSQQPVNTSVTNGGTASLSVIATGSAPLAYQWFFNGVALPGQTNPVASFSPAVPAQQGSYFVRVSNAVGAVDSATVTLSVLTPPSILVQPASVTNLAGGTATLVVQAGGSEPLFYRWRLNGAAVPADQAAPTLALPDVRLTNAGSYSVIVSNFAGAVTSVVAALTVIEMDFGDAPAPYATTLAQNGARHRLAGGIRLGATADFEPEGQGDALAGGDDAAGGDDEDGVTFNSPLRTGQSVGVVVNASVAGVLNAWVDFNRNGSWADAGEQIAVNRSLVAGNNSVSFLVPAGASIGPTFARFRFSTVAGLSFVGEAANGEVEDYALTIEPATDLSIVRATQLNPVAVGSNQNYTIVISNAGPVVATGVALMDVLPDGVNFVSATSSSGGCTHSAGNVNCAIGSLGVGAVATVTIQGLVGVEGAIQNSATVGANQIDMVPGNNSTTLTATALVAPAIVVQPAGVSVTNGGPATFTVGAVGTNLRYQWMRNGTNVTGGTVATLSFSSVTPAVQGAYTVRITNEVGSVTSDAAILTVLQPVAITAQPQSQIALAGSTVALSVGVSGTGPFSYQWEFNGADLVGQNEQTLVLGVVQTNQSGQYRVRVGNSLGSVSSAFATLTVYQAPVFVSQPAGQTNPTGGSATFSAGVVGTEPLRFQWYLNRSTVMAGQTNSTLVLTALQANRSGDYTLVVTNIAGAATSSVARLDVFDMDFGDAPGALGYPTTLALNGARHRVVPGIRLGAQIDFETNGVAAGAATGDDATGLDDEDGVVVPPVLLVGQAAPFVVTASTNGFLDAWIDLNGNGSWNDPGEQVVGSMALVAGSNAVPINIAAGALPGSRLARFRFSTAGGLSFDGFAADGEVEDYQVAIQASVDMKIGISDSIDPVPVTSNFVYTLSVTNLGSATAGLVWVTNALPPALTFVSASTGGGQGFCGNAGGIVYCLLGDMPSGSAASVSLTVRANSVGTLTNRAWVFSISGLQDAAPADNTNTQTTVVVGAPRRFGNPSSITVADAAPGVPGRGSLYPSVINVSGVTSALYKATVTVSNLTHDFAKDFDILLVGPQGQNVMLMSDAGASALAGVSLVFDDRSPDPLPSTGVIVSGVYRPSNYGLAADVFPAPAPSGPYGSTLGVFNNTDPNGAWSLYVVDGIVGGLGAVQGGWSLDISTADPIADLAVTVAASTPNVALGSNLVYSLTLTNRGPSIATSVRLTNALPPGVAFVAVNATSGSCANLSGNVVCDFNSLEARAGVAVSLTVMPGISGLLTNRVRATALQSDLVTTNHELEVVTLARPPTDLVVAQAPSTNLVLLGKDFGYTLYVTNRGPNPATNLRVTDVLPATVSFVSATSAQGACSNAAGVVACGIPSLASGAVAQIALTVTPTLVGMMTNVVTVASDEIDSLASNNSTTNVLAANVAADLAVSVTGGAASAPVNSILTYDVVVTNRGPSSALGVVLTNLLPAGFTFVSASSTIGSCEAQAGRVVCSLVVLDANSAAQVVIRVNPAVAGPAAIQFRVVASSEDFVPGNNSVTASVEVRQAPFISVQPQGRGVTNGASLALSVVAGGFPSPSYQWSFNGVDVPGATASVYSIASVTFAARGDYRVRVSNSEGSITSVVATVRVLSPPVISDVGNQLLNEDSVTAVVPFIVGDADTPAANLSVTASSSDLALIPVTGIALGGSLSNRTVRVTPAGNRFGNATITLRVTDADGLSAVDTFQVTVNPVNDPPTLELPAGPNIVEVNAGTLSAPIAFTIGDVESAASVLVVRVESTDSQLFPAGSLRLGGSGTNRNLVLAPPGGRSGSASISLTVTDPEGGTASRTFVANVTQAGSAPEIVVPPASQVVTNGARVTFGITATGTLPIVYQWQFNGSNMPGATNASLVLPSAGATNAGEYAVRLSNSSGSVTSAPAILQVLVPPTIASIARIGNTAEIRFATLIRLIYAIEYSDSLSPANWRILRVVAGTDGLISIVDPNPPPAGRFYRVRVLVAPTITSIRRVSPGIEIAFSTFAGLSYTVETSNNLDAAAWTPLAVVPGTGGIVAVRDNNPISARRVYRVRVE